MRSSPSKLVNTSAPTVPQRCAAATAHPLPREPVQEQHEREAERDRVHQEHLLERYAAFEHPVLDGGKEMRQPVIVKRLPAEKRIARRDGAFAHLRDYGHAPDHVRCEIRAVRPAAVDGLRDVGERPSDNRRHHHEQQQDDGDVGARERRRHEDTFQRGTRNGRNRERGQRRGEEHVTAHTRRPQPEQHDAAQPVAPDRADNPCRDAAAFARRIHQPRGRDARKREPDGDREEQRAAPDRNDHRDAIRDRENRDDSGGENRPPIAGGAGSVVPRAIRAGGFRPCQSCDLHRPSRDRQGPPRTRATIRVWPVERRGCRDW